jgi:hypothetical protein
MIPYVGDFAEDETIYHYFNTFSSDDPSASVTITNLVDADLKVHKDGGTTEATTDGATITIDFDTVTGTHLVTIDSSADAFYATGSDYMVRMEGTTVDGGTINAALFTFSIENRYSAGALRPTTAGRTLDVTAGGTAGIDWGNIENVTTTVGFTNTTVGIVTTNTDMRGTDSAFLASSAPTNFSSTVISAGGAVDSLVQGFLNNTIAETTADNIAANFETFYDNADATTTAVIDDIDSIKSSVGNLANVGSAVHKPASSYTLTTGTQSANTVSSTEALDGTRHEHTDTAGVLSLEYHFLIGGGTPTSVQITGYVTGPNDDVDVMGYDWVTAGYKQIGNIQGSSATTNSVYSFDLFVDMVGSGTDEGKVDIQFIKSSGLTSATLAVDQIFVAFSQGAEGYDNGAVWFNSNVTNTNTEVNIDGTARNPVSSSAALLTLLASTNLKKIEVAPGSTLTLGAAYEGYDVNGNGAVLALNSQDIGGSVWSRFSSVSGVGTTSANQAFFEDCVFATATLPPSIAQQCGFGATVTIGSAGDFTAVDCYSTVAGAGSPTFTKTAGQAVTAEYRGWHGGITQSGLQTGDVITIGGFDLGTVTLNGSDATVEIRGIKKGTTNNLTGSPTVNDTALLKSDIDLILADTGELQTDWTNGGRLDLILDELTTQGDTNETKIDTIDGIVDTILVDTGTTIPATLGTPTDTDIATDLANIQTSADGAATPTEVNAEVVDALTVDTYAESTGVPAATSSIKDAIVWTKTLDRNRLTQTSTTQTLRNDADSGNIATAATSDDGNTAERSEWT